MNIKLIKLKGEYMIIQEIVTLHNMEFKHTFSSENKYIKQYQDRISVCRKLIEKMSAIQTIDDYDKNRYNLTLETINSLYSLYQ